MAGAKLYRDHNLQIVSGVLLIGVMGVSTITPAFPKMTQEWEISNQAIGLLITAFTLPSVVLSPFIGILADRYGRKRILVPSLFLFGTAGGACAFTGDFNIVLVLRALQGIGGAGIGALAFTIIGDLFSGRQRVEALGLNMSAMSVGVAFYPTLGGALALLGYNYPFLLTLSAIPMGLIVIFYLQNPEPRSRENFREYLVSTWACLTNLKVVGLFGAGVLIFILLYGAFLTYFVLLMGNSFHASSFIIGLILSSSSIATAAVSSQMGRIVRRFSEMTLIKVAFPIFGLAFLLIPFMPVLWSFLVPSVIFGIAQGISLPSISTEVAGLAPIERRAAFMSVNIMMLRLGQTIGPPLMGILYVYTGIETTFIIAAILGLAATPVSIAFHRITQGTLFNST